MNKFIIGLSFIILAFLCILFYPEKLKLEEHIKIGYSFLLLFFGIYFITK